MKTISAPAAMIGNPGDLYFGQSIRSPGVLERLINKSNDAQPRFSGLDPHVMVLGQTQGEQAIALPHTLLCLFRNERYTAAGHAPAETQTRLSLASRVGVTPTLAHLAGQRPLTHAYQVTPGTTTVEVDPVKELHADVQACREAGADWQRLSAALSEELCDLILPPGTLPEDQQEAHSMQIISRLLTTPDWGAFLACWEGKTDPHTERWLSPLRPTHPVSPVREDRPPLRGADWAEAHFTEVLSPVQQADSDRVDTVSALILHSFQRSLSRQQATPQAQTLEINTAHHLIPLEWLEQAAAKLRAHRVQLLTLVTHLPDIRFDRATFTRILQHNVASCLILLDDVPLHDPALAELVQARTRGTLSVGQANVTGLRKSSPVLALTFKGAEFLYAPALTTSHFDTPERRGVKNPLFSLHAQAVTAY